MNADTAVSMPAVCVSPKGFLIERKLLRPLRALGKHERTLLRLDSIFSVSYQSSESSRLGESSKITQSNANQSSTEPDHHI